MRGSYPGCGGLQQEVGDGLARRVDAQQCDQLRAVQAGRNTGCEGRRGGGVGGRLAELVGAADVVEVGVGEDGQRVAFEEFGDRLPQGDHAEPGVDHQVTVGAAQPPQVGRQERPHPGLRDPHHPAAQRPLFVPLVSGVHGGRSCQELTRRQRLGGPNGLVLAGRRPAGRLLSQVLPTASVLVPGAVRQEGMPSYRQTQQ